MSDILDPFRDWDSGNIEKDFKGICDGPVEDTITAGVSSFNW